MTTQILNLPKLAVDATSGTNEDWLTAIAFTDGGGSPISLAGIAFTSELRRSAEDPTAWITAGTATADMTATSNILAFNVLAARMRRVAPDDYVFDVVATADGHSRVVVNGTLSVPQGITR